jgi:hypothetical protein
MHQARCKADSKGCDTHGGGLDERQTQTLLRTGHETHRPTAGNPGQTGKATLTRNQDPGRQTSQQPQGCRPGARAPGSAEPIITPGGWNDEIYMDTVNGHSQNTVAAAWA